MSNSNNNNNNSNNHNKTIVLLRHGESLGQTARSRGINRSKDGSLKDCFLTSKGIRQAIDVGRNHELFFAHEQQSPSNFDLICTSPLTRAVATCVLCTCRCINHTTSNNNIICHPDLAESSSSSIPENQVRPPETVVKDVKRQLKYQHPDALTVLDNIDWSLITSLNNNESSTAAATNDNESFLTWLSRRPETRILVVAHHNVIRNLVRFQLDRVPNCRPIRCQLLLQQQQLVLLNDDDVTTENNVVQQAHRQQQRGGNSDRGNNTNNNMIRRRIQFCSKLEQRKPSHVAVVPAVAEDIISTASKKFRWQGHHGHKKNNSSRRKPKHRKKNKKKGENGCSDKDDEEPEPLYTIRRVSDGKQVTVTEFSKETLNWLRDGDAVFVGPAVLGILTDSAAAEEVKASSLQQTAAPMPPLMMKRSSSSSKNNNNTAAVDLSNDLPSDRQDKATKNTPISSVYPFPQLAGNVLEEVRSVIDGDASFVERRVFFSDGDSSSFLSFDYSSVTRDTFPDPFESSPSKSESRRRLLRRECRGLLVDPNSGEVLARRLHKFWTVGERTESSIDQLPPLCENCVLTEKVDGSLVTPLLNENQKLIWASKRAVCNDVEEFVDRGKDSSGYSAVTAFAMHCITELDSTPIFEWIDPRKPVVIRYDRQQLVLLAVRQRESGRYLDDSEMRKLADRFARCNDGSRELPVTPRLPLDLSTTPCLSDLVSQIGAWDGGREGAVLRFPNDVFLKIKSGWYVNKQNFESAVGKKDEDALIHWIKRRGPLVLFDIPFWTVMAASLCGETLLEALQLLKGSHEEKLLFDFHKSLEKGMQDLHASLLEWGSRANEAAGGDRAKVTRISEGYVYGSEDVFRTAEGSFFVPWSVETLVLYARRSSSIISEAALLSSLRKDTLRLLKKAHNHEGIQNILNVKWPPPSLPVSETTSAKESLYSLTQGTVCRTNGVIWDCGGYEDRSSHDEGKNVLMHLLAGEQRRRAAVVLRGLPGVGKSSLTTLLRESVEPTKRAVVCSADDMLVQKNARTSKKKQAKKDSYVYDKRMLDEAHEQCFLEFSKACADPDVAIVICDNTNIRSHEIRKYLEVASESEGVVDLVVVEFVCQDESQVVACQKRNVHGVSQEVSIRRFYQMDPIDDQFLQYRVLLRPGGGT